MVLRAELPRLLLQTLQFPHAVARLTEFALIRAQMRMLWSPKLHALLALHPAKLIVNANLPTSHLANLNVTFGTQLLIQLV
jgi:hypothetical protein